MTELISREKARKMICAKIGEVFDHNFPCICGENDTIAQSATLSPYDIEKLNKVLKHLGKLGPLSINERFEDYLSDNTLIEFYTTNEEKTAYLIEAYDNEELIKVISEKFRGEIHIDEIDNSVVVLIVKGE